MKKFFVTLLLVITIISVTACSKKEQLNDEITEISLYELFKAFDSHKKLVFAIVDTSNDESKDMIKTLGNYQKTYNNNIYYVDTKNLTELEQDYVETMLKYKYNELRYYIIDDGQIQDSFEKPKSFKDVKNNLGTTKYQSLDIEEYLENRDKAYKKGVQALDDGLITTSYNYLQEAIPKEEAREQLESETYYMLNNWEEMIENGKTCTYFGMYFVNTNDQFYISEYNGPCDKFDRANNNPTLYNYYVKDNDIYIRKESAKDNAKYKKSFTIEKREKDVFTIKENEKVHTLIIVE